MKEESDSEEELHTFHGCIPLLGTARQPRYRPSCQSLALYLRDGGLATIERKHGRPPDQHLAVARLGSSDYVPHTLKGHRAIGVNERFRFYRYDLGQTFRWHRDGYFERPNRERSRLTLMVYVNDDFEGGHTRFEEALIKPVKGTALFFVHHLLHEGAQVTRGRKYVMRSDVMYSG